MHSLRLYLLERQGVYALQSYVDITRSSVLPQWTPRPPDFTIHEPRNEDAITITVRYTWGSVKKFQEFFLHRRFAAPVRYTGWSVKKIPEFFLHRRFAAPVMYTGGSVKKFQEFFLHRRFVAPVRYTGGSVKKFQEFFLHRRFAATWVRHAWETSNFTVTEFSSF
jgi:RNase P/RNase MRP subunit POP5